MKIGVCVPCYKRLKFTKFCVPMYIQNAGIEAHWYLVDDCSQDGTAEFLLNLALTNDRVYVIENNENMGIAPTRNKVFKRMLDDGMDIFVNVDNDLLLPMNWLRDLVTVLQDSMFSVIAPWFCNDDNINRQLKKKRPLDKFLPFEAIRARVGSTCILYKREIFERGIFYPDKKANWTYQDSQHHKIITHCGFEIALYTGVQAWRLEHIVWDDMEEEKLRVRHDILNKGDMSGFEKNLEHRKRSIPFGSIADTESSSDDQV